MKTITPLVNASSRLFLRFAPALVVAALMALCPANARANTIVFDDLGPGDTYFSSQGYLVNGASTSGLIETAAQFTAGASGFLATVDLGLTKFAGLGGPVSVFLYGNASGSPDNANQTFLGSGSPTADFPTTNNS